MPRDYRVEIENDTGFGPDTRVMVNGALIPATAVTWHAAMGEQATAEIEVLAVPLRAHGRPGVRWAGLEGVPAWVLEDVIADRRQTCEHPVDLPAYANDDNVWRCGHCGSHLPLGHPGRPD